MGGDTTLIGKATLSSQLKFFKKRVVRHWVLSIAALFCVFAIIAGTLLGLDDLVPRLGAILVVIAVIWEQRVTKVDMLKREKDVLHFTLVEAVNIARYEVELHRNQYHRQQGEATMHRKAIKANSFSFPKKFAKQYSNEMGFSDFVVMATVVFGTWVWAFGDGIATKLGFLKELL